MSDRRSRPEALAPRPARRAWRLAGACLLAMVLSASPLLVLGSGAAEASRAPLAILFVFPILLGAWLGGPLAALAATLASAACAWWGLAPLQGAVASAGAGAWPAWLALVGSGLLISAMAWSVARTRRRERQYLREARASEALYRSVFEHAGVGIVVADGEARVIQANRKMGEILGRAPGELIGQTPASSTHPDDQANAMAQLGQVLRGDADSVTFEKRYLHPDGRVVWTQNTATRVIAAPGETGCFMAVIQDISARRQAQAERDLFSEAVRQASQPMLIADVRFIITYANPAFCALFGYRAEAVAGRPVASLTGPDQGDREQLLEISRALERTGHYSGEVSRLAGDGTVIPVANQIGPIRDAGGAVIAWVASYTDLRPVRAKDAQLRRLAAGLQQSPVSVMMTGLDADIEYVNDAFVRHTGHSRESVIGDNPRLLRSGRTARAVFDEMWAQLTQGRTWEGRLINRRRDGVEYVAATVISPLTDESGKPSGYLSVQEDITDRLRQEAELDQHRNRLTELVAQRTLLLDAANRSLVEREQFIRNIADAVPGLVGYVDRDLRCRFANAT